MSNIQELFKKYYSDASGEIYSLRAPGRVNLIGEHTDYNDGFVLPIAINRGIDTAVCANGTNTIRISSTATDQRAEIELSADIKPAAPSWANYCRGVIALLIEAERTLSGCDILFDSDIPAGAGLSSSAALEVATAMAVIKTSKLDIPCDMKLAKMCQRAEHEFAGTPCGIMDQAIVVLGKANSALLLDCADGAAEHIPFGGENLSLLVCDTQVKHELNDGGYALRRSQCEQAAEILGLSSLRQACDNKITPDQLADKLDGDLLKRARHVVGEINRTTEAVELLKSSDYDKFGQLMYASHASLRDDYNVSCDELDNIVETASGHPSVYGARMTGGGFGGSAIILCKSCCAERIIETVASTFEKKFSRRCPIFATGAQNGAAAQL